MLYALVNNVKTIATKNSEGNCPLCGGIVFSKCGEINIHHWAHKPKENCDKWAKNETEWHKSWKEIFGKDQSEVVMIKENKRHIADVLTVTGVVIEFQNSNINSDEIEERNKFYGEKMLWVINLAEVDQRNFITYFVNDSDRQINTYVGRCVFFYYEEYGKRWDAHNDKTIKFEWKYYRRTWSYVKKNLFFDFGNDYLFWVKNWESDGKGSGKWIHKRNFVEKYGGDTSLLRLNENNIAQHTGIQAELFPKAEKVML
ncbi:MAG: competence protein CoiA [Bacteroidota bacterium]|jgi:competence CoiA-like predicted nuclease